MSVTEIDPPGTGPETHHLSLDSEAGSATAPASSSYVPRSSDRASYGLRHVTTATEHVLENKALKRGIRAPIHLRKTISPGLWPPPDAPTPPRPQRS